jgi:halocyanin-like protein
MNRRTFIAVAGATGLTAMAGCSGGGGAPEEPEYEEGWFGPVDEFDGFTDMTDQNEIPVAVGAGDSGFRFDPVAITVAPGTTIRWEWTGKGGEHNIQDPDEEWSNPEGLVSAQGHTWSREFSDAGTHLYECWPHSDSGMRGGIFVDGNIE